MNYSNLIANHLNQVYFGGNWTASNLMAVLDDVSLDKASTKVKDLNTILALSFHIHYYLKGTMDGIKNGELTIRDKFSFDHPTLSTESDWQDFKNTMWAEAKEFILLIEKLDDQLLHSDFIDKKYGSYYRNLMGIIEHTHYHLGQIVGLKKMIDFA